MGINGALEKDINLSIALKLKDLLEQREISVVLTRDSDAGLSPADATNKKSRGYAEALPDDHGRPIPLSP